MSSVNLKIAPSSASTVVELEYFPVVSNFCGAVFLAKALIKVAKKRFNTRSEYDAIPGYDGSLPLDLANRKLISLSLAKRGLLCMVPFYGNVKLVLLDIEKKSSLEIIQEGLRNPNKVSLASFPKELLDEEDFMLSLAKHSNYSTDSIIQNASKRLQEDASFISQIKRLKKVVNS